MFYANTAKLEAIMDNTLQKAETNGGPVGTLSSKADSYLTSNVYELLSLKERVVVITGGAKGIGLALAFAVAEAGGKVAIVDAASEPHKNYAKLQKICTELRYYQYVDRGETLYEPFRLTQVLLRSDVTDYVTLERTFDEISRDFGNIDGL